MCGVIWVRDRHHRQGKPATQEPSAGGQVAGSAPLESSRVGEVVGQGVPVIRGWACGLWWLGVFWNRWKSSLLIMNLFENCLKTLKCFPHPTTALSHLRIWQTERSGLRAVTPSQSSTARRQLAFPGTLVESFEVKRVSAWVQFIHSFNKSLVPTAHFVPRWVKSSQDVSLRPWQLPLVVDRPPASQPKFTSIHDYYSLCSLSFFHFETVIKTLDKSWSDKKKTAYL